MKMNSLCQAKITMNPKILSLFLILVTICISCDDEASGPVTHTDLGDKIMVKDVSGNPVAGARVSISVDTSSSEIGSQFESSLFSTVVVEKPMSPDLSIYPTITNDITSLEFNNLEPNEYIIEISLGRNSQVLFRDTTGVLSVGRYIFQYSFQDLKLPLDELYKVSGYSLNYDSAEQIIQLGSDWLYYTDDSSELRFLHLFTGTTDNSGSLSFEVDEVDFMGDTMTINSIQGEILNRVPFRDRYHIQVSKDNKVTNLTIPKDSLDEIEEIVFE